MADFIQTYFIDPIIYNTGYNPVNTAVYAVILIAAVLLVYKLVKLMKIKIDKRFFIGIVPFVVLGGVLRAWEDLLEATNTIQIADGLFRNFIVTDAYGTVRNMLLITPVMYITMFVIALAALLLAKAVEKGFKLDYYKTWFAIGLILNLAVLIQLRITNYFALYAVIFFTVLWTFVILLAKGLSVKTTVKKKLPKLSALLTNENTFLLN